MSDPTLTTLEKVLNSGDYEKVGWVPLFDAHEENRRDPRTGKPVVVKFDRKRLQEIADRCNRRAEETGDLSPIGIGHTVDDQYDRDGKVVYKARETDQPEIIGYGHNWRVGTFGPKGKLALLVDQYVRKDMVGEAKTYPRRSVELWLKDGFIDWIALLRRTPQRDLGLVAYGKDSKLRYSMGDAPMDLDTKPDAPDAVTPEEAGSGVDPTGEHPDPDISPEDHEKFKKCMKASYPHLDAMHSKYAAEQAAAPAMPGATDAAVPAAAATPPPVEEPMRMSRADAARVKKLEDEVEKYRKERDAEREAARLAEARRVIDRLGDVEGFVFKDRAKEALRYSKLSAEEQKERVTEIRTCHQQVDDPTRGSAGYPRLGDAPETDLPGTEPDDELRKDDERMRYAEFYRKNPDGAREEAVKYAKKRN